MMDNFIEFLYSKFLQSDGVSIDTRSIEPGNLFFALTGPNFNANQYAREALDKGAAFAVVDDEEYATDPRIIVADDCLKALQDLATFHRKRYRRKLLAITGSNGKTTTKELVSRVLGKKYIVHATRGNLNNHIGVPLTLLHIYPQVEVAVIEMGANHVGEIAQLCSFADPNYGLITNIGEAHTEYFGGIEGVLRGKSELFDHLRKSRGTPFINLDDERLAPVSKRFDHPIPFPGDGLKLIGVNPFLTIQLGTEEVQTRLIGGYNYGNIAAAIAVGREFGVSDTDILDAISTYEPSNQRSQLITKGNLKIINDAYNANPTSMKAAITNLSSFDGRKLAILGDMKEVEHSEDKHAEIGKLVADHGIDEVYFVGEQMKYAHLQVKGSHWFHQVSDLNKYLENTELGVGTLLIKASRSVHLEKVLDTL